MAAFMRVPPRCAGLLLPWLRGHDHHKKPTASNSSATPESYANAIGLSVPTVTLPYEEKRGNFTGILQRVYMQQT